MKVRIGLGSDLHELVPGRPCILGGVTLPYERGPRGHSDGDAVLHALTDALLGAAGLDDLGTRFPDDDARWAGADSRRLLAAAWDDVRAAGWELANADVVIQTEGPRIAPFRAAMAEAIAAVLGVEVTRINLKGKSFEGLGALAGGRAVLVQAVVLLTAD